MKDFKNLGIGEKFILGRKKFIVVKATIPCDRCTFEYKDFSCIDLINEGYIPSCERGNESVIFKESR